MKLSAGPGGLFLAVVTVDSASLGSAESVFSPLINTKPARISFRLNNVDVFGIQMGEYLLT